VTIEESLEMAGLIIFIWALLKYLAENFGEVRFRIESMVDSDSGISGSTDRMNMVGEKRELQKEVDAI
jgi:hypothetical protein